MHSIHSSAISFTSTFAILNASRFIQTHLWWVFKSFSLAVNVSLVNGNWSISMLIWAPIQLLFEILMWLDIAVRMTDHPVCSEWDSVNEMSETIFREVSFFSIAFDHYNLPSLFFSLSIHRVAGNTRLQRS
jgi:hypothetical protein